MAPQQDAPSKAELAADEAIHAAAGQLRLVSSLSPTNLRTEREAFLSGQRKNPQLAYDVNEAALDELEKSISAIQPPRTPVGELLEAKRIEVQRKIGMLRAVGTPAFSELSEHVYGLPDAATIADAHELLKRWPHVAPEPSDVHRLSAQAIVEAFRNVLDEYGLRDWTIAFSERTIAGVVVDPQARSVTVAAQTTLELTRLAPLITHEIETHVLTAENAREQPLALFVQGFAGYIRTQEGLAAYNVSTQHPQQGRPLRFWARNAIAVDLARTRGFREVFDAIRELGFTEHFAFGIAIKVKRGLTDTSQPGGWTKDYVYLAGRRDVAAFVAEGGSLRDLYVGKINLKDIALIKKLGWIRPARLLPRFLVTPTSLAAA